MKQELKTLAFRSTIKPSLRLHHTTRFSLFCLKIRISGNREYNFSSPANKANINLFLPLPFKKRSS